MKKTSYLFIILFIISCRNKNHENSHLSFLQEQKNTAKEFVLNLYKEYDLVILCERDHKEFTQYELIRDIVKDPYFIDNVGQIFTDVGVSNMDSVINNFLQSDYKDSLTTRKKVTSIFREIDYTPYWHCYSYPWFLSELHKINQTLSLDKRISLHPTDIAFDWSTISNPDDYKAFESTIQNRDSIMAQNIIKMLDHIQLKRIGSKKALIIMNYKHAFLKDFWLEGNVTHSTGRYLADQFKEKVASVYIMGLAIPEPGKYTLVKDGLWDYDLERLNITDVGFNLADSPFGSEDFDVIPPDPANDLKYKDVFTGLVFYKPVQEHIFRIGWNGFVTNEFLPELKRRIEIFNTARELGFPKEKLDEVLYKNNTEHSQQYSNIKELRMLIDQWKKRFNSDI